MSNCLFEATLQRIEKECNCVPRYFASEVPEIEICQGQSVLCMKELLDLIGDNRTVLDNGIEKVFFNLCNFKFFLSIFLFLGLFGKLY